MARKQRTGTVLKDKNDKSVIVGVSWLQRDRIYKKARRMLTKFVVHDEETLIEGFREAKKPLRMFAVAAIIENPWSGQYVTELKSEILSINSQDSFFIFPSVTRPQAELRLVSIFAF